jgi:hypothetical protein
MIINIIFLNGFPQIALFVPSLIEQKERGEIAVEKKY